MFSSLCLRIYSQFEEIKNIFNFNAKSVHNVYNDLTNSAFFDQNVKNNLCQLICERIKKFISATIYSPEIASKDKFNGNNNLIYLEIC